MPSSTTSTPGGARVSSAFVAPFYGARFDPPVGRPTDLDRTSLADTLGDVAARLIVIAAPAGYGKSTLAAQLHAGDPDHHHLWHPVEPVDNEPVTFIARLFAGLERLAPLAPEVRATGEQPTGPIDTTLLPMLLATIRQREPIRLTFDDTQHLVAPASLSILQQIIATIGEQSQVIVASRATPDLGLARLRVSGGLVEIGRDELALDLEETAALLGLIGSELASPDVQALHDRTEGWPAGVALAGIAMANTSRSPTGPIPSGRRREIADYLVDEVLSQQPDDIRSFLVRIALLRRFNAQLCDAMLDRDGSHQLLARLERINLFVVPLDDERTWYRFHHLFGELLNDQFERIGAPERTVMLRRAALWHLDHGTIDEALHYAQRSGDFELAGYIALRHGGRLIRAGQIDTLRAWIERSTNDEITSDPSFCIAAGMVAALLGDPKAHRFVSAAERLELDRPSPDGSSSIRSTLANLRAMIGKDGFAEMLADGKYVYEHERAAHTPWLTGGCRAIGNALVGLGRPAEAIPFLEEGLRTCAEFSIRGYQELVFLGHLALAHVDLGEHAAADTHVERGIAILKRGSVTQPVHTLALVTGEAHTTARRGERERARSALARVEELLDLTTTMSWLRAEIAVRCAEICWTLGDRASAHQFTETAHAALKLVPDSEALAKRLDQSTTVASGLARLSPAERKVLTQLATHLTLEQIAETLYVSRPTVKSQVSSIYSKLGIHTRAEAVALLQAEPKT